MRKKSPSNPTRSTVNYRKPNMKLTSMTQHSQHPGNHTQQHGGTKTSKANFDKWKSCLDNHKNRNNKVIMFRCRHINPLKIARTTKIHRSPLLRKRIKDLHSQHQKIRTQAQHCQLVHIPYLVAIPPKRRWMLHLYILLGTITS